MVPLITKLKSFRFFAKRIAGDRSQKECSCLHHNERQESAIVGDSVGRGRRLQLLPRRKVTAGLFPERHSLHAWWGNHHPLADRGTMSDLGRR